jgi:hypothetical protein
VLVGIGAGNWLCSTMAPFGLTFSLTDILRWGLAPMLTLTGPRLARGISSGHFLDDLLT